MSRDGQMATREKHESAMIMPGAHVQAGCIIGDGTRVWQFASVIREAEIGDDCTIAAGAIIDGCRLGNRVTVGHGASIHPGIVIGDDVFIGPHACFCNDLWPSTSKEGWFDLEDLLSGKIVVTEVERSANIGAGAVIMPGIRIGENAMIAAGAVVTKSVGKDMIYRRDGTIADANMLDRKRYVHKS